MFANDLTGICRNSVFGTDVNAQIPSVLNTIGNVPFNWGLGGYNVMGQYFHPAYGNTYGSIFNRFPQTLGQAYGVGGFVPSYGQNFVPATYGQGLGQTYGQGFGQAYGQGFGQTYGQGVGQGFGHSFGQGFGQGFNQVVPTFGQVNTPFFPGVNAGVNPLVHNIPFNTTIGHNPVLGQNQILAHNQILANALACAYGITPSTVANWTNPLVQSGICR